MLVDVVRLRLEGARLTREQVRSAVPTRGQLQLKPERPGYHVGQRNSPMLAGLVAAGTTDWALPPLDRAQVRRISGDSMLIAGMEETRRGREWRAYPQVWWCRLVQGSPAPEDRAARPVVACRRLPCDELPTDIREKASMCYSAQIWADCRKYVRLFGATMDLREFVQLFWHRRTDSSIKVPKALEDSFADPQTNEERQIAGWIEEHRAQQATQFEQQLFQQRTRLVEAERKLQAKVTKAATDSQRIARSKIEWAQGKLADLRRREATDEDSRIFPGYYAPVMVVEDGRRVIKPMRYQCRPAGAPAFYDAKFPGTYNARRDNLQGQFWKPLFGFSHGLMVVNAFFENVAQAGESGDRENVVLEFRPRPREDMLVACLWSRWTSPGQPDLLSFAAITDEPPAEVAAAGHDRCIIPIKRENVDAWLVPDRADLAGQQAILEDRARPFYEHRMAA